jgi:hypothetical protein
VPVVVIIDLTKFFVAIVDVDVIWMIIVSMFKEVAIEKDVLGKALYRFHEEVRQIHSSELI